LDIGYWILDIGYWILDIGYWILDIGYWILDIMVCSVDILWLGRLSGINLIIVYIINITFKLIKYIVLYYIICGVFAIYMCYICIV